MLFIGLALVIAVGIALLISADAGTLIGLSQMQTAQLVPLVIILIIVAGGMSARRFRAAELVGGVIGWVGIFAIVIVTYTYRDEIFNVAQRVAGELQPGVALVDAQGGTATFRRGMNGHFEVRTNVNGHETPMVFDTGASTVVLTVPDAEAAGINTEDLRYIVPVSTANGQGLAARVRLSSISVGGIERRNITALVTREGVLETSLLGMTFLETLSRYSVTQNSLEIAD
ncbi:TIGR02281 family clan AA aspartic protease [Devosia sp. WQ 349]|uniref:retropepsin-like aspartic protease family protein n=1 Tax=Devosia sp. WQ 349K1 TaxID=2800329 RepID=UPI0019067355|nr:TIGR02281 family clan AA aspartic protease [Devosia sp. WQ 349K1]MBK1794264.1 TIGR02281 family clan AA aspartic protease [Devosia sp. WQ 349K1]